MRHTDRDEAVKAAFDRFHTSTDPKPAADKRLRQDLKDADNRAEFDIKTSSCNGDYVVSTVKLAAFAARMFQDHTETFETMVFPAMGGQIIDFGDVYSESHATAEEARDAHRRIVKDVDRKRIPGKVRA